MSLSTVTGAETSDDDGRRYTGDDGGPVKSIAEIFRRIDTDFSNSVSFQELLGTKCRRSYACDIFTYMYRR